MDYVSRGLSAPVAVVTSILMYRNLTGITLGDGHTQISKAKQNERLCKVAYIKDAHSKIYRSILQHTWEILGTVPMNFFGTRLGQDLDGRLRQYNRDRVFLLQR